MDYDQLFGFLICSARPAPPTLSSSRLQRIVEELGRLGYATTLSVTTAEACSAIRSEAELWLCDCRMVAEGIRKRG